jgi:hypothetical protein
VAEKKKEKNKLKKNCYEVEAATRLLPRDDSRPVECIKDRMACQTAGFLGIATNSGGQATDAVEHATRKMVRSRKKIGQ